MNFKDFYKLTKYKLYCDMDGVLCDFEQGVEDLGQGSMTALLKKGQTSLWRVINQAAEPFWSEMDWMKDGEELWKAIKGFTPTILSTPSRSNNSKTGKRKWCAKKLGSDVKVILISNKEKHASKNSILIDDTPKKINKWKKAGGIGILHKTTKQTLKELEKILNEEST